MRPGNTGYSGQKSAGISCDGIQQKKGGLNRVITTVIALAASGVQAEYRGMEGFGMVAAWRAWNEAIQVRTDTSAACGFVTRRGTV